MGEDPTVDDRRTDLPAEDVGSSGPDVSITLRGHLRVNVFRETHVPSSKIRLDRFGRHDLEGGPQEGSLVHVVRVWDVPQGPFVRGESKKTIFSLRFLRSSRVTRLSFTIYDEIWYNDTHLEQPIF